jgi:hypothetical protein
VANKVIQVPLPYVITVMVALTSTMVGIGHVWGQSVQINTEQDRRIASLEEQGRAVQELAAQQATINALLEQQQKSMERLLDTMGERRR